MKKYIIISLCMIFCIAILSGYITYKKTNMLKNEENVIEKIEKINIQEEKTDEKIKKLITENVEIQEEKIYLKGNNDMKEKQTNNPLKSKVERKDNLICKKDIKKEISKEEKVIIKQERKPIDIEENKKNEEKKYNEYVVNVAKPKECVGNKHSISAGNTGKWYKTKDEAIATYRSEIKKWGDKWKEDLITEEEYNKKCPYGYEVWTCPICQKWTLNYYYNN